MSLCVTPSAGGANEGGTLGNVGELLDTAEYTKYRNSCMCCSRHKADLSTLTVKYDLKSVMVAVIRGILNTT